MLEKETTQEKEVLMKAVFVFISWLSIVSLTIVGIYYICIMLNLSDFATGLFVGFFASTMTSTASPVLKNTLNDRPK